MNQFEEYLHTHQLEALTVSVVAHVRYGVVWKALRGQPISLEQANNIRASVQYLTGIPIYRSTGYWVSR